MNSLTSGAHCKPGVPINVNTTMGAAILWWQAAVLGTVLVKCDCSTPTGPPLVYAEVPALVTILATGVFTAGVASIIGLDMLLFFVRTNPIAGDSGEVIKGLVAAVAGRTFWQAKFPAPIPTFIIRTFFRVAAEGASRVNLNNIGFIIADSIAELCFANSFATITFRLHE